MSKVNTLEKLEHELEMLQPEAQLLIMEKLARLLRKSGLPAQKGIDWRKLYGAGKGVWQGEDAQEYVNRSREERP
jgi:hypothetical protein